MAEKLTLDDGIIELDINGNGLLRFNPADPNLYRRFIALARELPGMEAQYTAEVETAEGDELAQAEDATNRMYAMDADIKARLNVVFGPGADFDRLLDGVNLLAPGHNGQRVITNLIEALRPYTEKGMERYRQAAAADAVAEAKENRAQRRAK